VWLLNGLPALLRERGIKDDLIERLLILNPRRAFAFAAGSEEASQ